MSLSGLWTIASVVLVALALGYADDAQPEKCKYSKTVDLTNHTRFENGSYLYHDTLVPEHLVDTYDYRLVFRNIKEEAEPHVRGCVCGKPNRFCIKLCCEPGSFFNDTANRCEPIPPHLNMPTHMKITLKDSTEREVTVLEHFEYQVGLPCAYPEALANSGDIWELLYYGHLFILNDNSRLDTVSYCLTPYQLNGTTENVLIPMSCPMKEEISWKLLLNTYGMAISVVFLVPTVLVYVCLKELRGNMRGKLLICYLISLIVGYSNISLINISGIIFEESMCEWIGIICYYFFMAAFLWLSVLCLDIWLNFREHSIEMTAKKNRIRFILYSLYVWLNAGVMSALTLWAQHSDKVPELYKPGLGIEVCWINTNKWAASIYFYCPNLIILIFNIVTFSHLTLRIYRVRRDLAKMTQKERFIQENRWKEFQQDPMDPILPTLSSLSSFSSSALVILRLFLIMGISWVLDILSYCLRHHEQYNFLFVLTDFCNAIQGVLIFVLFVFKRNVLNAIRKRFSTETRKPRPSGASFTTQFSKLSSQPSSANHP